MMVMGSSGKKTRMYRGGLTSLGRLGSNRSAAAAYAGELSWQYNHVRRY